MLHHSLLSIHFVQQLTNLQSTINHNKPTTMAEKAQQLITTELVTEKVLISARRLII